jgi:hypothetical protein
VATLLFVWVKITGSIKAIGSIGGGTGIGSQMSLFLLRRNDKTAGSSAGGAAAVSRGVPLQWLLQK